MFCKNKAATIVALGTTITLSFAHTASALTFNITYDEPTLSVFGANLNAMKTATQYVANEYSSLFSNNVTLDINVRGNSTPSVLGQSYTYGAIDYNYQTIKNALIAKASTSASISATNSLPTIDPTNGGNFFLPNAQAKALGLEGDPSEPFDGIFTVGTAKTYTFDPNNRAVLGAYDFIGLAEHEFSEIMGRIYALNKPNFPYSAPFDLFRFTAPGVRNLAINATNVYFSTDNGMTAAKYYNNPGNGADIADWATTPGDPDAYDAFGFTGEQGGISAVDVAVMNTLGWQSAVTATSVPEPLTIFGTSLGAISAFRIRKKLKSTIKRE
jgi:hypothetical protein